ncbi:hypothetical protein D3C73_1176770 [compost metagenome]
MLGNPRARRAQGQQASQCAGIFRQQHQIGRTARHGLNQRQYPLQHQIRVGMLYSLSQQARDKGIEAFTPQTLHGAQLRAAAQAGQRLQRFTGIGEAALLQLTAGGFFILGFLPQRQPFTAHHDFAFGTLLLIGIGDHLTEMPGHTATPVHQLLMERRPVGEAQHEGNARLVLDTVGQHLRLAIGNRLDRMLGVSQELVTFAQFIDHRWRQVPLTFQRTQHF